MSLPSLLLVDDSEAILAFERAALSGHYACTGAVNGVEALEKVKAVKPAAVLLDLSMPEMDGDEVLARLKLDPETQDVPVIIISSERARAEACLKNGAAAYLPKPIRADELLALVGRVLDEARRAQSAGSMAVLTLLAGPLELGIPLDAVRTVLPQLLTQPLPLGPKYLGELFELDGQPVFVLDLPARLGLEHAQPLSERKLVVVGHGQLQIALCVDEVRDPEEFAAEELTRQRELGGGDYGQLAEALLAVARGKRGLLPVIDPQALLSRELQRKLSLLRPHAGAA